MNLQICVPYEKCVYDCKFCIAKGHMHNYKFNNLFEKDADLYLEKLYDTVCVGHYQDLIITGECDPSQNMQFVKSVLERIPDSIYHNLELQTKNYHIDINILDGLDVLSYSISHAKDYFRSYGFPRLYNHITRAVILLTKEFDFLNKDNFYNMGFDQITFKVLQYTEDILGYVDKWIKENRMKDLSKIYEIVDYYSSDTCSIRIDTSCQMAKGRYSIFRSDGNLYETWKGTKPL